MTVTQNYTLEDLSIPAPAEGPLDWNKTGLFKLRGLLPDDMITAYQEEWKAHNGWRANVPVQGKPGLYTIDADRPGGYDETAYMRYPALMRLCTYQPLADALEKLVGEPMGVHLNLTGWVTTARNFHQDTYLNPPQVGDYYAAVWMCLDDVHRDSGPFQYVPGSHRWHQLTRDRVGQAVNLADPTWPKLSEDILTPLVENEVKKRGCRIVSYLPKRGDVLIWHSRLYHRGSVARVPGTYRGGCIAHYSGVHHRDDMPAALRGAEGGWFFPLGIPMGARMFDDDWNRSR